MAYKYVDVADVNVFEYDTDGNRYIVTKTMQVKVDEDYQIDGVCMPTPTTALVTANPMTKDAKRLPGNGEMIAPYLGTAFNVTWKYAKLNAAQFKLLYDNYVKSTISNKNMFHTIKTIDMNEGVVKELTIYMEASFGYVPFMTKNGVRMFRDVTLTMVDKAGEV